MPLRMFSRNTPAVGPATDIAAEAEATTTSLDQAVSRIKALQAPGASKDLVKHTNELDKIRGLVQKIRFQEDLHTPPVAVALATLKVVMDRLASVLKAGS